MLIRGERAPIVGSVCMDMVMVDVTGRVVEPGDEVVSSGVFKLRTGMAVKVDNKIQPSNSPEPKPEDS